MDMPNLPAHLELTNVPPKDMLKNAFRKSGVEVRESWEKYTDSIVAGATTNAGQPSPWPDSDLNNLKYDEACEQSNEVYDYLSDNCKIDFPKQYWELALEFIEDLMDQRPEKPFKWAERWFLQRSIDKERRLGQPTASLERILADEDSRDDPFHLEKFMQQVMESGASRGQSKMNIEDFLYHIRTFSVMVPDQEERLAERFYASTNHYIGNQAASAKKEKQISQNPFA